MCYNALHWLWHGRGWETRWVFLLSVWSIVLLEEGFTFATPGQQGECPASPQGWGSRGGSCWSFPSMMPDTAPCQDEQHTERRPWTCARPSPPRSLGTSRAHGNGACGTMSRQHNKLCICLIDAAHGLSRARSKLLQWITKLPWLQGSYFDLHHQHFTAADKSHAQVQYFRPVQWSYMKACQGYLFICTHEPRDLQLFINTSWAICFLFLAGMLCAGNSCQPLGAVLLRAAASDKESPLRIQLES